MRLHPSLSISMWTPSIWKPASLLKSTSTFRITLQLSFPFSTFTSTWPHPGLHANKCPCNNFNCFLSNNNTNIYTTLTATSYTIATPKPIRKFLSNYTSVRYLCNDRSLISQSKSPFIQNTEPTSAQECSQ